MNQNFREGRIIPIAISQMDKIKMTIQKTDCTAMRKGAKVIRENNRKFRLNSIHQKLSSRELTGTMKKEVLEAIKVLKATPLPK